MATPHPMPNGDIALVAFARLVASCQGEDYHPERDVAAALTLGLLIARQDPEVAAWLLWAIEGENDRAARAQGISQDSEALNYEVGVQLARAYRKIMEMDAYWQKDRSQ
jgi:hypothetical protein